MKLCQKFLTIRAKQLANLSQLKSQPTRPEELHLKCVCSCFILRHKDGYEIPIFSVANRRLTIRFYGMFPEFFSISQIDFNKGEFAH